MFIVVVSINNGTVGLARPLNYLQLNFSLIRGICNPSDVNAFSSSVLVEDHYSIAFLTFLTLNVLVKNKNHSILTTTKKKVGKKHSKN